MSGIRRMARAWWRDIALAAISILLVVEGLEQRAAEATSAFLFPGVVLLLCVVTGTDIRFRGIKIRTADKDSKDLPSIHTERTDLHVFAYLTIGDVTLGRRAVMNAVSTTGGYGSRIPSAKRHAFTVQTLISCLRNAKTHEALFKTKKRKRLKPKHLTSVANDVCTAALSDLPFDGRVCYLLELTLKLNAIDIAAIVGRPLSDVLQEIDTARSALEETLLEADLPRDLDIGGNK